MKKLFAILAVAGFLTACGDSATETTKPADSGAVAPAAATLDTAAAKLDTAAAKIDTAAAKVDTAAKK